jgi:hypothetical protein
LSEQRSVFVGRPSETEERTRADEEDVIWQIDVEAAAGLTKAAFGVVGAKFAHVSLGAMDMNRKSRSERLERREG